MSCRQLKLESSGGKKYETDCADTEGMFRIIVVLLSGEELIGEYQKLKGLKRKNLRDHMDDFELIFTMFGERATTEIHRTENSQGVPRLQRDAQSGGKIAGDARKALEKRLKRPVVSSHKFIPDSSTCPATERTIKPGYSNLLQDIKSRIRAAQYEALKAVNKELISLYWDIGRMIAGRQRGETWGKSIVQQLAADLQKDFPGMQGFSAQNLWYMRQLYLAYCGDEKLQPMVGEIGWSHNLIIMGKCKDPLEREFYIRMTRRMGWSKNVLAHQIENKTYEKTVANQTNFTKTMPAPLKRQAKIAVKNEYTFDFLELGEEHSEMELERALMAKINRFLIEMGGTFAFFGNQYRLEIDRQESFIDILLYHRRLKCLVAVELKVGRFQSEFVGKMQFYLAALDDLAREKGENPSIGIILCKDKDKTIVEYALRESKKPIGVAKYKVVSRVPADLKGELPAPEQIKLLLEDV